MLIGRLTGRRDVVRLIGRFAGRDVVHLIGRLAGRRDLVRLIGRLVGRIVLGLQRPARWNFGCSAGSWSLTCFA